MNQKQKAYTFLAALGVILFVGSMMWLAIALQYLPNYYKEIKCYDRFQNEIIGQKCLEEYKKYPSYLMIPIVMAFAGVCWIIISVHALQIQSDLAEDKRLNLNNHERRY